jgi:hypothetical protein
VSDKLGEELPKPGNTHDEEELNDDLKICLGVVAGDKSGVPPPVVRQVVDGREEEANVGDLE